MNGDFVSGDWIFKDGGKFHGKFKNNKPAPGNGYYLLENGVKQEGRWVQNGSELLWQSAI